MLPHISSRHVAARVFCPPPRKTYTTVCPLWLRLQAKGERVAPFSVKEQFPSRGMVVARVCINQLRACPVVSRLLSHFTLKAAAGWGIVTNEQGWHEKGARGTPLSGKKPSLWTIVSKRKRLWISYLAPLSGTLALPVGKVPATALGKLCMIWIRMSLWFDLSQSILFHWYFPH